jgi:hypothetical protein
MLLLPYAIVTPQMEKLTVVADANPAINLVVVKTCFMSKPTKELAAIVLAGIIATPSSRIVKVAEEAAVLLTTMLVTVAVVAAGTVYRVALEVAAAFL